MNVILCAKKCRNKNTDNTAHMSVCTDFFVKDIGTSVHEDLGLRRSRETSICISSSVNLSFERTMAEMEA